MTKRLTHDELIEDGISQILRAFGKGEDLRGAVWYIVTASAQWGADYEKHIKEVNNKAVKKKKA